MPAKLCTVAVIFKTALEVAVANDRIARRYSGLAERLDDPTSACVGRATLGQPGIPTAGCWKPAVPRGYTGA